MSLDKHTLTEEEYLNLQKKFDHDKNHILWLSWTQAEHILSEIDKAVKKEETYRSLGHRSDYLMITYPKEEKS